MLLFPTQTLPPSKFSPSLGNITFSSLGEGMVYPESVMNVRMYWSLTHYSILSAYFVLCCIFADWLDPLPWVSRLIHLTLTFTSSLSLTLLALVFSRTFLTSHSPYVGWLCQKIPPTVRRVIRFKSANRRVLLLFLIVHILSASFYSFLF